MPDPDFTVNDVKTFVGKMLHTNIYIFNPLFLYSILALIIDYKHCLTR